MSIEHQTRFQGGVISRRQVRELGGDDNLIERMLRRRQWHVIYPGVYVDHTGTPSDEQVRMAAVLFAWPAALAGESALIAHGVRNISSDEVTVAIDASRRVQARPGMRVLRMTALERMTLSTLIPERIRLEAAVLQVASARWRTGGEGAVVGLLSDVCQQRRTTPGRLLVELGAHPCLPGRSLLKNVLADVESGAFSLLEHRYLSTVERAHGLPRGRRQFGFRNGRRGGFRDVYYPEQRTVVELDGRLGHEWAADRWADLERDLLAATDDLLTTRLGWGTVADPCRLATKMGRLLQSRGWGGEPTRCPRCCPTPG